MYFLDPPFCATNRQPTVSVSKGEKVNFTCDVNSNPRKVYFNWVFNSTNKVIHIHQSEYINYENKSVVSYSLPNGTDYGMLLCWGKNEIGAQTTPCVYHIIQASKYNLR